MPLTIQGVTYYRTHEALAKAGISRATFYRWLASQRVPDSAQRDRNGQRLFTEEEIQEIAAVASRVEIVEHQTKLPLSESTKR